MKRPQINSVRESLFVRFVGALSFHMKFTAKWLPLQQMLVGNIIAIAEKLFWEPIDAVQFAVCRYFALRTQNVQMICVFTFRHHTPNRNRKKRLTKPKNE